MTLRMTALPKVALTIALVAVGFTGVAQARGHGPAPIAFADLDVDGDGQITAAEIEAQGAVRFAKIDTDSDGLVSAEELAASGQEKAEKRAARMIEKLDADKDGKLSAEELEARGKGRGGKDRSAKMLKHFDTDETVLCLKKSTTPRLKKCKSVKAVKRNMVTRSTASKPAFV